MSWCGDEKGILVYPRDVAGLLGLCPAPPLIGAAVSDYENIPPGPTYRMTEAQFQQFVANHSDASASDEDEDPKCHCWQNGMPRGEHYKGCYLALGDRMAAMLRRLEWAGCLNNHDLCPVCGGAAPEPLAENPREGAGQHSPACELAALLRDLP